MSQTPQLDYTLKHPVSQVDDAQLSCFQKSLTAARQRVVQRRMGSFKQIEQVINIVEKTLPLPEVILRQKDLFLS